jgi:hypothetical protein
MKLVVGAILCTAAVIGQISTASAQHYGQPGGYYYYGSPAGIYYAQPQIEQDLGWNYTRNQPATMPLELDQANCGQPRRRVAPRAHKLDMENQRVTVCETYPCTHAPLNF